MYWRSRKRNLHLKAQIGIQFMIVASISFLILTAFIAGVAFRYKEVYKHDKEAKIKDLAFKLREELFLSTKIEQSYKRSFSIPDTIRGKSYTITAIGNFLTVTSDQSEYTVFIPQYSGTIQPGINTITKNEEGICINC